MTTLVVIWVLFVVIWILYVVVVAGKHVSDIANLKQPVETDCLDECKRNKLATNKQDDCSATVSKAQAKGSIMADNAMAAIAGAALASHMAKRLKHDDARDISDDDIYLYDDELDEFGILDNLDGLEELGDSAPPGTEDVVNYHHHDDDTCHDDELDAYDDFIASLD